jgi:uncharacterized RDD family membrane protein YckC
MAGGTPDTYKTQNIEWQARLQGVRLASFRRRAAAFGVDLVAVTLLLLLPGLWETLAQRPAGGVLRLSFEFGSLASVAVALAYFGLCTWLGHGATPGKKLMGIRVVSLVHSHLSLWHSVERTLGYAASSLEAGFGFAQYFTHPNRQTVHDRIAETIVVVMPRRAR